MFSQSACVKLLLNRILSMHNLTPVHLTDNKHQIHANYHSRAFSWPIAHGSDF